MEFFFPLLTLRSQAAAASSNMAAPANGSAATSQTDRKGIFTVMDSSDQPKLKSYGRMMRTRLSIKRHLQKHGLTHADSDSDQDEEESELEV